VTTADDTVGINISSTLTAL